MLPGDVFADPRQAIRDLQRQVSNLADRRQEYAAKASVFAQRLQEFYD